MKFGVDNLHVTLYGSSDFREILYGKRRISHRRKHEILPSFINFFITFGTGHCHEYVRSVLEFRKYGGSRSRASLTVVNEYQSVLSTLNY